MKTQFHHTRWVRVVLWLLAVVLGATALTAISTQAANATAAPQYDQIATVSPETASAIKDYVPADTVMRIGKSDEPQYETAAINYHKTIGIKRIDANESFLVVDTWAKRNATATKLTKHDVLYLLFNSLSRSTILSTSSTALKSSLIVHGRTQKSVSIAIASGATEFQWTLNPGYSNTHAGIHTTTQLNNGGTWYKLNLSDTKNSAPDGTKKHPATIGMRTIDSKHWFVLSNRWNKPSDSKESLTQAYLYLFEFNSGHNRTEFSSKPSRYEQRLYVHGVAVAKTGSRSVGDNDQFQFSNSVKHDPRRGIQSWASVKLNGWNNLTVND